MQLQALQGMLETYPDYAFEGRVQELADERQIQQRKREFAKYFAVGLTQKGATKIFPWEAAIVALCSILLTIVVNIPLMALMLEELLQVISLLNVCH